MQLLQRQPNALPPSASDFRVNFVVIGFFFILVFASFRVFPGGERNLQVMLCLLICAALLWIYDRFYLKVQLRPSAKLSQPGPFDLDRLLTKLVGLWATFAIVLFLYWFMPFYRESLNAIQFYGHFFDLIQRFGLGVVLLSLVYFAYVDRRQEDPYDSYWHTGCLFLGRWKKVNWVFIREHSRVWLIKAFFTPFMFGLLVRYLNVVMTFSLPQQLTFFSIYNYLLNIFYTCDVMYGVLGYVLTLRMLDTHIQSTETTWWGWGVCLACYSPFYNIFGIGLLKYQGPFIWDHWLSGNMMLYYLCGILIIASSALYGLATIAFGYRMSNLTFRGIITEGPYRLTKHPAYIGKIMSWWLISLPFLSSQGPGVAISQTLALVVISMIYFFRARTEENHLANYPEYIQYAKWIDEHGLLSPLKKRFPFLRFSEERCRRSMSKVWFNQ